jgi:hypothetical protein
VRQTARARAFVAVTDAVKDRKSDLLKHAGGTRHTNGRTRLRHMPFAIRSES